MSELETAAIGQIWMCEIEMQEIRHDWIINPHEFHHK